MRCSHLGAVAVLSAVGLHARPHPAESQDRGPVVLTVGSTQLRVADVQSRLAALPAFQRRTLGETPDQIRKNFLHRVLVPELLHAVEAQRRGLGKQDAAVAARINEVLRQAMERALRDRLLREDPPTDEELERYYETNRARYQTPRRIRIWRILVSDEKLARQIIADAQGPNGVAKWSRYARRESKDKATAMRKGELGFVRPDGRTDVPRVRVDPALFAAADTVADGELVPDPVKEGDRFAAVWRRGSLPAVSRSLQQELPALRATLLRRKLQRALDGLVAELRKTHVTRFDESWLEHLPIRPPDFAQQRRAQPPPRSNASADATPRASERGLR